MISNTAQVAEQLLEALDQCEYRGGSRADAKKLIEAVVLAERQAERIACGCERCLKLELPK